MADQPGVFAAESSIVYFTNEVATFRVAVAVAPDSEAWAVRIASALNAVYSEGVSEADRG